MKPAEEWSGNTNEKEGFSISMKKLKVQKNHTIINNSDLMGQVMVTPPIDEDFWVLRVHLFEDQYLVAFPKFKTYGIGFSIEENWNTNLPYNDPKKLTGLRDPDEIYDHIKRNRRYIAIKRKRTVKAIQMLQEAIIKLK